MFFAFASDFLSPIISRITSDKIIFSGLKLSSPVCDFAQFNKLSSKMSVFLAAESIILIYFSDCALSVSYTFLKSSSEKPIILLNGLLKS